jgi:hypothetical protein
MVTRLYMCTNQVPAARFRTGHHDSASQCYRWLFICHDDPSKSGRSLKINRTTVSQYSIRKCTIHESCHLSNSLLLRSIRSRKLNTPKCRCLSYNELQHAPVVLRKTIKFFEGILFPVVSDPRCCSNCM